MKEHKKGMPQCNYCKAQNQAEWSVVYGELPTHDYTFCCTDHISEMIREISEGKNGEVKALYLTKWNTEAFYDPEFNQNWSRFYRKLIGAEPDDTPDAIKGLNRVLNQKL